LLTIVIGELYVSFELMAFVLLNELNEL